MNANATVRHSSNKSCSAITTYTLPPLSGIPGDTNSSLSTVTCKDYNVSSWMFDVKYWPFNSNYPNRGRNTTIANLYSFGTPMDEANSGDGAKAGFSAYKCSFYFCVKGYSGTTTLGKPAQQSILATADQTHLVSEGNDTYWVFDNLPEELNSGSIGNWSVDEELRQNLGGTFADVLSGNDMNYFDDGEASVQASSAAATLLFQASSSLTNLTTMMQGVSDGLTAYIRSNGPVLPPDPQYAPTVGIFVSIVVVRWAWLSYAIVLLLGGLIFLGLTICITHRRKVRPWKGHRVPLLLADLDESIRARAQGGLAYRQGLDDRVGAVRVRLDFDGENGIAFRRVHDSPQLQTLRKETEFSSRAPLYEGT